MITLPKKPKTTKLENNKAVFEIEACYPGYGTTLGSAFRRVLLSSLPGAAVTGVKIKGVQHEFSTIPNIAEDVVQIILNLKQVRFKLYGGQPLKATLRVKGEKEVAAGDIKTPTGLEITNPKAHIATLTAKKAELDMEIDVEPGLGYIPIEHHKKEKIEIGKIAVDAIFTPIKKVISSTTPMRVGERTDYDRLKIDIETDGTITPEEAFIKAAQILVDHFEVFTTLEEEKKTKKKKEEKTKAKEPAKKKKEEKKAEDLTKTKVDDMKMSLRTINALKASGVKTVSGLTRKSAKDLEGVEGLGEKAIIEIKKALGKLGLTLKS